MVAVDHCEANSHSFCLGAFDNWEELAVAAGAPDDFLSAHFSFMLIDAEMMFSVCEWKIGCGFARKRVESDGGGGWW